MTRPFQPANQATARSTYRRLADGYREFRRFSRRSEMMWRYTCNLRNVMAHRLDAPHRTAATRRVVADLNKNGVALTTVTELLGSDGPFRELESAVSALEATRAADVEAARSHGNLGAQKTYNLELLGDGTPQRGRVFERFAEQPSVSAVADDYFGMKTTLRACNVWHTFVTREPARQSQLWHRDPEDRYILKMFVLLSDVDEGAGPFTYASGTHMKGDRNHPFVDKHGLQDDEMAAIVKPHEWVKGTGTRGSVIFADTRGYHKGGLVREHERLMFVSMFLSY